MRIERKSKRVKPKSPDSWDWLDAIAGTFDEDFLKAVLERPEAINPNGIDDGADNVVFKK